MALFGTGSNTQYWRASIAHADMGGRTSSVSTSIPIWVSVWQRGAVASPASNQGLASFGSVSGGAAAGPYIDTGGSVYAWDRNDAGSFQQSTGSAVSAANTWQHFLVYYATTASRQFYSNGALGGSDANSLASTQTFTTLNVCRNLSASAMLVSTNRSVAEVVFGRGVLSSGQIGALARGANPLDVLSPTQIVAYFPLLGGLDDFGPQGLSLVPIGGATAVWGSHPPVAPPRRKRASLFVVASGNSVFFTGLARFQSQARFTPPGLTAPLVAKTEAQATARAVESQSTSILGLAEAMAAARAAMSPATPIVAKTEAVASARATSALSAPLTGKTEAAGTGKASLGLATSLVGKTEAGAQGRASTSSGAILSALARAGAASAGRAAMALSAAVVGKGQASASARATETQSTTLAGRTSAAAQGRASAASGAILFAAARAGGAAAGRAASSLTAAIVGKGQAGASARASVKLATSLAARAGAVSGGRAATGLVAQIVSVAAQARTSSAGRATLTLLIASNRGTRLLVARVSARAATARAAIRRFTA